PSCRAERSADGAPLSRTVVVGQVLCVRSGGAWDWLSSVRFARSAKEHFSAASHACADAYIAPPLPRERPAQRRVARPTGATSRPMRAAPTTATARRRTEVVA